MDVILIYKGANPKPIGVGTSKRAAISLIVKELLDKKIIQPAEVGYYRNEIHLDNKTLGLKENYSLEEITTNKLL